MEVPDWEWWVREGTWMYEELMLAMPRGRHLIAYASSLSLSVLSMRTILTLASLFPRSRIKVWCLQVTLVTLTFSFPKANYGKNLFNGSLRFKFYTVNGNVYVVWSLNEDLRCVLLKHKFEWELHYNKARRLCLPPSLGYKKNEKDAKVFPTTNSILSNMTQKYSEQIYC